MNVNGVNMQLTRSSNDGMNMRRNSAWVDQWIYSACLNDSTVHTPESIGTIE